MAVNAIYETDFTSLPFWYIRKLEIGIHKFWITVHDRVMDELIFAFNVRTGGAGVTALINAL